MSYEILIKTKRDVMKRLGADWAKIGQIQKKTQDRHGDDQTYLADEYGYTPVIDKVVTEEYDIYRQTVEELDLAAVIKAVNGLG